MHFTFSCPKKGRRRERMNTLAQSSLEFAGRLKTATEDHFGHPIMIAIFRNAQIAEDDAELARRAHANQQPGGRRLVKTPRISANKAKASVRTPKGA